MTLFESKPVDPAAIQDAARLTRIAAVTWFAAWVLTSLFATLFLSGTGEMAMLGLLFVLVLILMIGIAGSVISLRLALRALRLDATGVLTKLTIALNLASLLFALLVAGLLVSDFVG